ncbi:MAG: hypothetical protein ACR2ME_03965 [Acidimicrobiia bacterium]
MLEPLEATRVVARPDTLDAARLNPDALLLRLAPDDVLVIGGGVQVEDPFAIVVPDSGWVAWRIGEDQLREALVGLCAFEIHPGFNQGMVAGLPAKVWIDGDRSLVIVAAVYAAEFEERFR